MLKCGSTYLSTSVSVATVLRRLRLPDKTRRLWIDTISINQEDDVEQTCQVKLMHRIYKAAYRTIIWFGEADKSTGVAFKMLEALHAVCIEARKLGDGQPCTFETLKQCSLPSSDDSRWEAFERLLFNRWFTRTWVLQEVCLSSNSWVHKGPHQIEWSKLSLVVSALVQSQACDHLRIKIHPAYPTSTFWARWSDRANLLSLLCFSIDMTSTKKVDKVFALIGLATDQASTLHLIDYSKTASDIYLAIAKHYLGQGYMAVLNLASDPSFRELNELPTWVPDWSCWPRAQPMLRVKQSCDSNGDHTLNCANVTPNFSRDGSVLVLRGIISDRVRAVGTTLPHPINISHRAVALGFIKQWHGIARSRSTYPTGESIDEAFARTIIMDWKLKSGRDRGELFHAYMKQFLFGRSRVHNTTPYLGTSEFHKQIRYSCMKRTFFVTDSGYFGVGPYHLRPGDQVALFANGVTPYIIRKAGKGKHSFVGDAYIHGMMDADLSMTALEDVYLV